MQNKEPLAKAPDRFLPKAKTAEERQLLRKLGEVKGLWEDDTLLPSDHHQKLGDCEACPVVQEESIRTNEDTPALHESEEGRSYPASCIKEESATSPETNKEAASVEAVKMDYQGALDDVACESSAFHGSDDHINENRDEGETSVNQELVASDTQAGHLSHSVQSEKDTRKSSEREVELSVTTKSPPQNQNKKVYSRDKMTENGTGPGGFNSEISVAQDPNQQQQQQQHKKKKKRGRNKRRARSHTSESESDTATHWQGQQHGKNPGTPKTKGSQSPSDSSASSPQQEETRPAGQQVDQGAGKQKTKDSPSSSERDRFTGGTSHKNEQQEETRPAGQQVEQGAGKQKTKNLQSQSEHDRSASSTSHKTDQRDRASQQREQGTGKQKPKESQSERVRSASSASKTEQHEMTRPVSQKVEQTGKQKSKDSQSTSKRVEPQESLAVKYDEPKPESGFKPDRQSSDTANRKDRNYARRSGGNQRRRYDERRDGYDSLSSQSFASNPKTEQAHADSPQKKAESRGGSRGRKEKFNQPRTHSGGAESGSQFRSQSAPQQK